MDSKLIEREKNSYRLVVFHAKKKLYLPVIIGGSTTVDGPKNDGISLDVVTGVFKSPVCRCWLRSAVCCWLSGKFNVGCEWCPLVDDVVVIVAVDETTVESVFDVWVTEVEECELVLMLLLCDDVLTVLVCRFCWLADCRCWCWCICCWWWFWLLIKCVCDGWWLLFVIVWLLLLFKLNELAVVAAVLKRLHVSKLSTLKCAAAADSVKR